MKIEDNSSQFDQEEGYPKSKKLAYSDFKDLFNYEENDRDKKELKRDYKKLEKDQSGNVKFKHLIGKCT